MCPECSGIVCQNCLAKVPLKDKKRTSCAKCRQNSKAFVRCRQVEEIIASSLLKKKEICNLHALEKVLCCIDCSIAVCPVCFYEDERHRGH